MPAKCIAEMHADTSVMVSYISHLERGTDITYEEHFTKWLGRPVRSRADLPTFDTVRKTLRRDYGLLLSRIHGKGYRIKTQEEAAYDDERRRRMRRQAREEKKDMATIELAELSDPAKLCVVTKLACAHIVEETSSDKGMKKLAAAANGTAQPLALAKALDALKHSIGQTT